MAVMMLSSRHEGSNRAEDGHPPASLMGPAVGWVRNIPLPTLVVYREKASHTAGEWNCWVSKTESRAGIPQGDPPHIAPRTARVVGDVRLDRTFP